MFSSEEPGRLIPSSVRSLPLESVPVHDAFERPLRSCVCPLQFALRLLHARREVHLAASRGIAEFR